MTEFDSQTPIIDTSGEAGVVGVPELRRPEVVVRAIEGWSLVKPEGGGLMSWQPTDELGVSLPAGTTSSRPEFPPELNLARHAMPEEARHAAMPGGVGSLAIKEGPLALKTTPLSLK